jgi:hypothetical protein
MAGDPSGPLALAAFIPALMVSINMPDATTGERCDTRWGGGGRGGGGLDAVLRFPRPRRF